MATTFGRLLRALCLLLLVLVMPQSAASDPGGNTIGIVLMHGKGGSPTLYVADLALSLEARGILVANVEMPWSGQRNYDVDVAAAEKEVEAALASLRGKGAAKLFVAGHSQGGLFALYFGDHHAVDGVIAIAPGANVGSPTFREKLGDSVALAHKLVADGKGQEKARLFDYEGSRGSYPVIATPAAYLSWFDPEGAMNQSAAIRNLNPTIPVLYIAPTHDYPGLLKVKQQMFDALPRNPHTQLYEPSSSHMNAPSASAGKIAEWTRAVANAR